MTPKEAIKQINSLIENSKSFHTEKGDIWEQDIVALNIAKKELEKEVMKKSDCNKTSKQLIEEMAHLICEMASKPDTCKECPERNGGCFTIPKIEKLVNDGYVCIDRFNVRCSYCDSPIYIKTVQYTAPLLAPLTEEQALRDRLTALTGEVYVEIQKRFCPVCGRKIKENMESFV